MFNLAGYYEHCAKLCDVFDFSTYGYILVILHECIQLLIKYKYFCPIVARYFLQHNCYKKQLWNFIYPHLTFGYK